VSEIVEGHSSVALGYLKDILLELRDVDVELLDQIESLKHFDVA